MAFEATIAAAAAAAATRAAAVAAAAAGVAVAVAVAMCSSQDGEEKEAEVSDASHLEAFRQMGWIAGNWAGILSSTAFGALALSTSFVWREQAVYPK